MKKGMLKLLMGLVVLFSPLHAASSVYVVSVPPPVMRPSPAAGGASIVAVIPVAALALSIMYDKEQACDRLPIKTKQASNGNYSYEVAGCDQ